jgi:hypothetical protein
MVGRFPNPFVPCKTWWSGSLCRSPKERTFHRKRTKAKEKQRVEDPLYLDRFLLLVIDCSDAVHGTEAFHPMTLAIALGGHRSSAQANIVLTQGQATNQR